MFSLIWNFLTGKKCLVCGCLKQGVPVCKTCSKDVEFLPKHPKALYKSVAIYACAYYGGVLRKIIHLLKYKKKKKLVEFCAKTLYEYWINIPNKKEKYIVCAVPLHKKRNKRRGFNQAELIAKEFCGLCDYEYLGEILTREKYTKVMYNMRIHEREANLKDAFSFHKELYNEEELLLIDDITTTGATFKEIIRECEKHGVNKITCLALSATKYDT